MYFPGVRPEYLIRGLEVLGLDPKPDPLLPQNWDSCAQYHEKYGLFQFFTGRK
jgi:hypothetical protein